MMTRIQTQLKRLAGYTVLASALLLVTSAAQAASIPYADNFDDDALGTTAPSEPAPESGTFAEDVDASWSVIDQGDGDRAYGVDVSGDDSGVDRPLTSTLDFGSTFDSDPTFRMSVDFNVNSYSDDGNRSTAIGLGALGDANDFSGPYYLGHFFWAYPAKTEQIGKLGLFEGGAAEVDVVSDDSVDVDSNDHYRLTFEATPNGSELDLTLTIENLTKGQSAVVSATDPNPVTGPYFGFRSALSSADSDSSLDAEFDNFSVAIPEPATMLVVMLGGVSVMLRRSRKRVRG